MFSFNGSVSFAHAASSFPFWLAINFANIVPNSSAITLIDLIGRLTALICSVRFSLKPTNAASLAAFNRFMFAIASSTSILTPGIALSCSTASKINMIALEISPSAFWTFSDMKSQSFATSAVAHRMYLTKEVCMKSRKSSNLFNTNVKTSLQPMRPKTKILDADSRNVIPFLSLSTAEVKKSNATFELATVAKKSVIRFAFCVRSFKSPDSPIEIRTS